MHDADTVRLRNQHLQVAISPVGAELQSLKCVETDEEFLWQGDPAYWSGRAPILFPIVGSLKNNSMLVDRQKYEIERHGLVRRKPFSLVDQSAESCVFSIIADASTLDSYPWQFEFRVAYQLQADRLDTNYKVINHDSTTMVFTLGSHPAFALPEDIWQYTIQFSESETLKRFLLTDDGLLTDEGIEYLKNTDTIALSAQLFDEDALVFKNIKSRTIDLLHNNTVRVSVDTGGAPHLGLWAKPAAPFVCIEPWFGHSDTVNSSGVFKEKPAMIHLAAGESFSNTWSISIPA